MTLTVDQFRDLYTRVQRWAYEAGEAPYCQSHELIFSMERELHNTAVALGIEEAPVSSPEVPF